MSNFDFTDLILLVGTNPLPNYVVGKYFLGERENKIKRIFLVHTTKTQDFAKALAKKISQIVPIKPLLLTSEAHGATIRGDIASYWKKEENKPNYSDMHIHINYTGGTKAMSIHVIQAFQELQKSGGKGITISKLSYSYLEADKHKMYNDDEPNPISGDLRKIINIELNDLLEIHKYNKPTNGKNPISDQMQQDVSSFCKSLNKNYLGSSIKVDLRKIAKSEISLGFALEHFVRYFLEEDSDLKKLISDGKLKVCSNLHLKQSNWPSKRYFEIDILLLFGYELIGISCYAGRSIKMSKLKGFEIMHRVTQLGGEEAKSILVTGLNTPKGSAGSADDLENELKIETGNDNIKVLGLDDWQPENLLTKIKEFIGVTI